jgi:hypothetical protein
LLGYTAGYIVGGRERAATTVAQTPPTPQPQQTPGTTGQTAAKDFSDQAISPTVGRPSTTPPAVSADVPPTAATKTPAARPREAPAVRRGRVVVNSSPSNASVTINGKWSGRTPLTLDDLAFGKYVVRVVEPGYQVARQEISLSPATASRTMSVKLRRSATSSRPREEAPAAASQTTPPVPSTGEIFVDSRPQGARVSIDGKPFGTTPVRVPGQTVGSHTVRLELADHAPWTSPAQVIPGKTVRVTGSLERIR